MTRPLRYTDAQRRAVTSLDRSLVVTAGAGSGKTRVLVDRYLNLVDPTRDGGALAAPDQVVAITFTTKAVREMIDRVREAVRERMENAPDAGARLLWRAIFEQTSRARIQTIHSFCSELLREFPVEAGIDPEAGTLQEFEAQDLLEEAAAQAILSRLDEDSEVRTLAVERGLSGLAGELADLYRSVRAGGEDLPQVEAASLAQEGDPLAASLIRTYLRLLADVGRRYTALKGPSALDFEDLQLRARNMLRDHPAVLRRLQGRIRYLLVDEFQDTDALQDEVVRLLAGDPPGDRLFVVGDPKQSIYRFRHAEVGLFREWQARVAERQGEVVFLAENFRSQRGLVEFVNVLFARLMGAEYEPLAPGREAEVRPAVELLLASRGEGEKAAPAALKEARLLASRLRAMVEGGEELVGERPEGGGPEVRRAVRYGDMAILLRTRNKLRVFETALAEQGIPYYVVGGTGFYQKPEVRDLLSALRAIDDPDDRLSLAAALRSPLFALPDDALLLLAQLHGDLGKGLSQASQDPEGLALLDPATAAQVRRASDLFGRARRLRSRLSVPQLLDLLIRETGYEAVLSAAFAGVQKVANVEKLRQVAFGMMEGGCFTLTDFLAYFDRLSRAGEEAEAPVALEGGDTVKILTVHGSKGLEFPVVAVADLSGRFRKGNGRWRYRRRKGLGVCLPGEEKPIPTALYASLAEEEAAEERAELVRLLYVAVTRARDHLLLSGFLVEEAPGGQGKKVPECWLNWLLRELNEAGLPEGLVVMRRDTDFAAGLPPEAAAGAAAEREGAGQEATALASLPASATPGVSADETAARERLPLLAPVPWPGRRTAVATVSELMCYAACPRRYHLQYRLAAPAVPGWEGPGSEAGAQVGGEVGSEAGGPAGEGGELPGGRMRRLTPAERGSVVHRVIERLRSAADLERLLAAALEEAGVAPEAREEAAGSVRPLLERYLAGPEFAAVLRGGVVETEAPFYLRLAPELLLRGVVDRLDRTPEGLRILDFKTNLAGPDRARAEAAGYYRLQIPLYALAIEAAWQEKVASGAFIFLASGTTVETDLSPVARAAAREEALRLSRGIETGGAEPRPSSSCAYCGYLPLCDAGRSVVVGRQASG